MAAKDKAIKKAMGKEVSEELHGDDEDLVHELIGDLFAPGNARLHFEMPIKKIASHLNKYRGSITSQAVKAAMDTYDKLAADGTLQKDYDNDNGFLLPEHILILKKAFGLIGLYGKDMNEYFKRPVHQLLVTRPLEETKVMNEFDVRICGSPPLQSVFFALAYPRGAGNKCAPSGITGIPPIASGAPSGITGIPPIASVHFLSEAIATHSSSLQHLLFFKISILLKFTSKLF